MNYTPEIRKILVPVELSENGRIALNQAMVFHRIYQCDIILLHIITENSSIKQILQPTKLQSEQTATEAKLNQFAQDYFNGSIPEFVTTKVVSGALIASISKISKELECDLIIIKKKNREAEKSSMFKSENADKLIANSACPVITIPDNFNPEGVKDILIPIDITKKVQNKVAWVKYLAKRFNARIHIVSVLDVDIKPIRSFAYRKALKIKNHLDKAGLASCIILLKSKKQEMHDVVIKHIDEVKPDLVLTMTHQESALFSNYIGKFATEIIHRATTPVFSLVPSNETLMVNLLNSLDKKAVIAED